MENNPILDLAISNVRILRTEVASYSEQLRVKREAFNDSIAGLTALYNQYKDFLEQAETRLRNEALVSYQKDETKNKEIYLGIKERDVTEFKYSEEKALEYCMLHTMFVSVNNTALKNYLRSLKGKGLPSFVTEVKKETITLPSEL